MRIERRFWPLSEQSGRQCKHERRARGRTVGRDLCRLSIRLSHRYRSSSPRSRWIKHSIGLAAAAPRGRQWWYFWNSTVRLKYLTVYLPLPRFLLTRAHGRFAVSVLSFVKIIHEALLLPFVTTRGSIVSILAGLSRLLPPFPSAIFRKTNHPSADPFSVWRFERWWTTTVSLIVWDDVTKRVPSLGGTFSRTSIENGVGYKFFETSFFLFMI